MPSMIHANQNSTTKQVASLEHVGPWIKNQSNNYQLTSLGLQNSHVYFF